MKKWKWEENYRFPDPVQKTAVRNRSRFFCFIWDKYRFTVSWSNKTQKRFNNVSLFICPHLFINPCAAASDFKINRMQTVVAIIHPTIIFIINPTWKRGGIYQWGWQDKEFYANTIVLKANCILPWFSTIIANLIANKHLQKLNAHLIHRA